MTWAAGGQHPLQLGGGERVQRVGPGEQPLLVSLDPGGGLPDAAATEPAISADGRYVAFTSAADDLEDGDENLVADVYVRDAGAGRTLRASVDRNGGDPESASREPAISDDGRHVAFTSRANDLVAAPDSGADDDVYVRDLPRWRAVRP